jgi:hypothetical protein
MRTMFLDRSGSNHYRWLGDDNIGEKALHRWIRYNNLPEPQVREICEIKPPYDLANITGI